MFTTIDNITKSQKHNAETTIKLDIEISQVQPKRTKPHKKFGRQVLSRSTH